MKLVFFHILCSNHGKTTGMQPKEFFDISKEQNILVFFTKRLNFFVLGGFSDVDFAGSIDDRASTSGYLMNMGLATVSWICKKQATMATSSVEVEYISAWEATCEIVWLHKILQDLGISQAKATSLFIDS
jgi:hypothetical protein